MYFCRSFQVENFVKIFYWETMRIKDKIEARIRESEEGTFFFISDFAEQGNDVFISRLLSEYVDEGLLCRLSNGIYYKPISTKFGVLYPEVEQLAEAIARRDNAQILPTGAAAQNILGLSTQIPLNHIYLTSGSARKITIGDKVLVFKRCVPKNFSYSNEFIAILIQALKSLGKDNISPEQELMIKSLIRKHADKKTLKKDLGIAPLWIRKKLFSMAKEENV